MWIIVTSLLAKTGLGKLGAEIVTFIVVAALVVAVPLGLIGYGKHVQYREDLAAFHNYEAQVKLQSDIYDTQLKLFRAESEKERLLLTTKMKDIQERKAAVETKYVTKEVIKYVSKSNDKRSVDANVFTNGWVYLHDLPLAGTVSGVSSSLRGDAEAPTGLTASTVVRVDGLNLNECVARGEVIKLWQDWYVDAKNKYEGFVKALPPPVALPKSLKDTSPEQKRATIGPGLPNPFEKE